VSLMFKGQCPCSRPITQMHDIDGKDIGLCNECHTVLSILMTNYSELPISLALQDYEVSNAEPKDWRPAPSFQSKLETEPVFPSVLLDKENKQEKGCLRPFFVCLEEDHNEILRKPPEIRNEEDV